MKDGFLRDFIQLVMNGLMIVAPAATVMFAYGHVASGLILMLGGAGKSLAYVIGWNFFSEGDPIKWGEHFTGLFIWGSLGLSLLLL